MTGVMTASSQASPQGRLALAEHGGRSPFAAQRIDELPGRFLDVGVHGSEREGDVLDRACEDAGGVERGAQGEDAGQRPASVAGLQAHGAGHAGGNAYRAGGVGTQSDEGAALHEADAGTGAGASGHAVGGHVPRVHRRPQ
ncbi:MAG: hypothetical protein M5U09_00930 [Gammaproteobacteria bacterium]|nr:hypothetical protein [Gammaproteobacteria bacterium]